MKKIIKKYSSATKTVSELKGNIVAPKFQRNFIWSTKARKELLSSIKDGLPIGSFLLRTLPDGKYDIIDGRQRFSTLLDYQNHTYNYIEEADIDEESLIELISEIKSAKEAYDSLSRTAQTRAIKEIKNVAVKSFKDKDSDAEAIKFEIVEKIKEAFKVTEKEDAKKLNGIVAKFVNNVREYLDIDSMQLPCIVFNQNASDEDVLRTFIYLNTRGTKLSKYDLYSASWQDLIKMVDDLEIIERVVSKYKDSLESNQNIQTNGFDENTLRVNKEINIFEYGYAVSKLIGEKCNYIYKTGDSSVVDPLAFSVLSGIFNVESKKMFDLGLTINNKNVDLVDLKNKIVECAKDIEDNLEWYCIGSDKRNYFNHAYNQLVSYIVTVFKTKYGFDENENIIELGNKAELNIFYKNLPMWYLYDNLRGYWLGSGDSKLDSLVLVDDILTSRYFTSVPKAAFESVVSEWLNEVNNDKNDTITPQTKLFINYIIKKKVPEKVDSLDLEHIIPQARLQELFERTSKTVLGISSPANITLLPSFDNRSKREKTYYEMLDAHEDSAMSYDATKIDKYCYPKRDDIRFVESKLEFTMEAFDEFKKKRSKALIGLFFDELYYR